MALRTISKAVYLNAFAREAPERLIKLGHRPRRLCSENSSILYGMCDATPRESFDGATMYPGEHLKGIALFQAQRVAVRAYRL